MSKEEEQGSFVPEEQKSPTKQSPPSTDANSTLFIIMREIRDALKENTEAVNSLLTTLVGQTREEFITPQGKVNVTTSIEPPTPDRVPLPEPTTTKPEPSNKLEEAKMLFPEDLENLLTFTDEETYIKVKPRQFLGSDSFAKVAAVVRGVGGEYKSAGKESHFRIPKK